MSPTPELILDSVRPLLIFFLEGQRTLGSLRRCVARSEGLEIPAEWDELDDATYITKAMQAEILYRTFKRAEIQAAPIPSTLDRYEQVEAMR